VQLAQGFVADWCSRACADWAADEYAHALLAVARHGRVDAKEMTALIEDTNQKFGVNFPPTVVDKMQEIFRNSGGFVTIISDDRVLAGAIADVDAYTSHRMRLTVPTIRQTPPAEPRRRRQIQRGRARRPEAPRSTPVPVNMANM